MRENSCFLEGVARLSRLGTLLSFALAWSCVAADALQEAPEFKWVAAGHCNGGDVNEVSAVVTDVAGDTYVAGVFCGSNYFLWRQGFEEYNSALATLGGPIYVGKYDREGRVLWVRQSAENDRGMMAACLATSGGGVFLLGTFYSTNFTMGRDHLDQQRSRQRVYRPGSPPTAPSGG